LKDSLRQGLFGSQQKHVSGDPYLICRIVLCLTKSLQRSEKKKGGKKSVVETFLHFSKKGKEKLILSLT